MFVLFLMLFPKHTLLIPQREFGLDNSYLWLKKFFLYGLLLFIVIESPFSPDSIKSQP